MWCRVLYFPPYSPDLNPIETAFSTVKTWIKKNRDFKEICTDPEFAIRAACSQITPEMAKSYFEKSNYIWHLLSLFIKIEFIVNIFLLS